MPIVPPGGERPRRWRYTLSCGCTYVAGKIDDPYSPVLCRNHEDAAETGILVSIIRLEQS